MLPGVAFDLTKNLGRSVTGTALRPLLKTTLDDLEIAAIGREIGQGDWLDYKARQKELRDLTVGIADAIERGGVPAYRKDRQVTRICGVTLAEEVMPAEFRHVQILPAVQVADTSAYRRELACYLSLIGDRVQMAVFSAGWVHLSDLRRSITALSREVSKLAYALRKDWKADLFFRNIEMTYHRENGELMINLHSHAFIEHPFFQPAKYEQFKEFIRASNAKGYVHLSHVSQDTISEAVKYPFKPEKSFKTDPLSDSEWAEIARQTYRMRLFTPMGGFKTWRQDLAPKDEPKKRIVVKATADGPVFYALQGFKKSEDQPEASGSCRNDQIIGVLKPAPRFSQKATPAFLVTNRSKANIEDVLREGGHIGTVNRWRAIYNARTPFWDERLPIMNRANLTPEDLHEKRIATYNGLDYLICEKAERFDQQIRAAKAAKVMRHKTTLIVLRGSGQGSATGVQPPPIPPSRGP